ncbi:MAG TPA: long-chain fatty acid--CoA ligase [Candidatus Sulfomarinibacteraceae bacterium]|nr:long-chain fatty acid--CoA ligase [Candidatus Sulfomarinibacteraceae bacterium]
MTERTVLDFFRHEVEAPRSEHYAHWTPSGRRVLTTEQFFDRTAAFAAALTGLGVGRGDRVMLLSDNRPEWHMVDFATLSLGAVDVPVYGTLTPEQIAYQAKDSGAKVAVVETPEQMAKLLEIRKRCPELEHLVQIEGERERGVSSFGELVEGAFSDDAEAIFWDRANRVAPGDLMTIIYTSGTTGDPKGVMLSHDNVVQNVLHSAHRVPVTREDLALEFLPLCHILERMVGYIYAWKETSKAYCSVYHVGELLSAIRPTLMVGVPRFYEKVMQKVTDAAAAAPAVKRGLFNWALELGHEEARHRLAGKPMGLTLTARHAVADRLVLSKVREGLGGRLRFCLSGGAELPLHVAEFFHALGVFLVEGYGLTETSPVVAVNGAEPGTIRLGTVGRPLDNVEIRLAKDGELLVRGPSVMMGYWNKPEHTAEVFTDDGFFATGDIAEVDDDGFLLIVDRKKDLIVTAGGKNVAPQPIESRLKQSPYVESAVLVGDRRPFIVALISPSFDDLERWARRKGLTWSDHGDLVERPEIRALYDDVVASANASLARYEQIKKVRILPLALSIEGGQLTPTLKVKRRVVEQQFADVIGGLYGE